MMGFVSNYILNLPAIALGRQPTRPLLFSYYVTHRCNLNCRYCCDGDGKRFKETPIPELSAGEVRELLTILRRAANTLDITGGEPMMRKDLEEILACAGALGFRVVLNTKGIGLEDRPDILRLADTVVMSLDTLDTRSLAEVMGRPERTAERALEAMRFAVGKRKEFRTRVVLSAVATPVNLDEVEGVLLYALENSLGFHVSPEIVGTRVNQGLVGNSRYERLMAKVIEAKKTRLGVLGVPGYLKGIRDFRNFHCHPLLMPTIRPDGKMYYPCLESTHAEIDVRSAGDYVIALETARKRFGRIPECRDCCHVFCHMALSLLQRSPVAALMEMRDWRN
jgi:MoaA/NifB/PqqE/SkfB family radical SAM enzyme